MHRKSLVFGLIGLVILLGTGGCGSGPKVVAVSGTLKYKGKPVTNAFVNFVPSPGRPSVAETDSEGRFTLRYDLQTLGAEVGKHKVFVQHNPVADASKPGTLPGVPVALSADQKAFFDKYGNEKSTIEVTIEKPESNLQLNWE